MSLPDIEFSYRLIDISRIRAWRIEVESRIVTYDLRHQCPRRGADYLKHPLKHPIAYLSIVNYLKRFSPLDQNRPLTLIEFRCPIVFFFFFFFPPFTSNWSLQWWFNEKHDRKGRCWKFKREFIAHCCIPYDIDIYAYTCIKMCIYGMSGRLCVYILCVQCTVCN